MCAQLAVDAALTAIQIHGGYGYMEELGLEKLARDAKLLELGAGTTDINRLPQRARSLVLKVICDCGRDSHLHRRSGDFLQCANLSVTACRTGRDLRARESHLTAGRRSDRPYPEPANPSKRNATYMSEPASTHTDVETSALANDTT